MNRSFVFCHQQLIADIASFRAAGYTRRRPEELAVLTRCVGGRGTGVQCPGQRARVSAGGGWNEGRD